MQIEALVNGVVRRLHLVACSLVARIFVIACFGVGASFLQSCATQPSISGLLLSNSASAIVRLNVGVSASDVGADPRYGILRLHRKPETIRLVALKSIPEDNGASIDGELWESVYTAKGIFTGELRFATYGEWQVDTPEDERKFVENRTRYFNLVKRLDPDCGQLMLMCRAGRPNHFLIIGLHGSVRSAHAKRWYRELEEFDQNFPIESLSRREVYPMKMLTILR